MVGYNTINIIACIDPVTNLVEILRISNKLDNYIADQFANVWLSRYLSLNRFIHNNGGEFTTNELYTLLDQNSINPVPTMVKNSQSNWMCE